MLAAIALKFDASLCKNTMVQALYLLFVLLETYNRLELERRKTRVVKQAYKGPMIRYHSMTMPLIEEIPSETEINVDEESSNGTK